MYRINSNGPRIEPRGTPQLTFLISDVRDSNPGTTWSISFCYIGDPDVISSSAMITSRLTQCTLYKSCYDRTTSVCIIVSVSFSVLPGGLV